MSKKMQFVIMFIFTIGVGIILYYFDPAPTSFEFHKQFYKEEYIGIVKDVFIDEKNHHNKTILCIEADSQDRDFKIRTPDGNKRIFEIVSTGDTIIKELDSNKLYIKGASIDTIMEYRLRYPRR
ncbi:hypothetical protein EYV94_27585 [Puteibacter caeruleilacunae]|nr:hypothetical protein EYV94_27585 [Puteibacter caeruleilacunae]